MKNLKRRENMLVRSYQHYNRTKFEDDVNKGRVYETCFSHVDPTLSHLNYNLHSGNMIENYNNIKNGVYIKNEKDFVAYCDLCITLPKDYEGDSKIFFKNVYDILMHDDKFKHCIGAFVHLDETSPHMHFVYMPIIEQKKDVQRQIKVFSEKKQREVTKRITFHYNAKFDAKSILSLQNLRELHPWMQKQLEDRGIECSIITKERVEYNKFKAEVIEQTKNSILADPGNRDFYINDMFKILKEQNPREYKKHFQKANQGRFNFFLSMLDTAQKDALKEAGIIVDNAKQQAADIVNNAKQQANEITSNASKERDEIIKEIEDLANRKENLTNENQQLTVENEELKKDNNAENKKRLSIKKDKESEIGKLNYFRGLKKDIQNDITIQESKLSSLKDKIQSLESYSKSIIDMATLEANEVIEKAKTKGRQLIEAAKKEAADLKAKGTKFYEDLVKESEDYYNETYQYAEDELARKTEIARQLEEDAKREHDLKIKQAENEAKKLEDEAKKEAKQIIEDAKQRKQQLDSLIQKDEEYYDRLSKQKENVINTINQMKEDIKSNDKLQEKIEYERVKAELSFYKEKDRINSVSFEITDEIIEEYCDTLQEDMRQKYQENFDSFCKAMNNVYKEFGFKTPYPEYEEVQKGGDAR